MTAISGSRKGMSRNEGETVMAGVTGSNSEDTISSKEETY